MQDRAYIGEPDAMQQHQQQGFGFGSSQATAMPFGGGGGSPPVFQCAQNGAFYLAKLQCTHIFDAGH